MPNAGARLPVATRDTPDLLVCRGSITGLVEARRVGPLALWV